VWITDVKPAIGWLGLDLVIAVKRNSAGGAQLISRPRYPNQLENLSSFPFAALSFSVSDGPHTHVTQQCTSLI
jgi:hypothetical protein